MPGVALLLEQGDAAEEEEDGGREGGGQRPGPLGALSDGGGHQEQPEPEADLSEVVWVAGHAPQAHCTPLAPVTGIIPENIDKCESEVTNFDPHLKLNFCWSLTASQMRPMANNTKPTMSIGVMLS